MTPRPDTLAPDILAALGRTLAAEEARLEPVSDEEIDAYVDGTADEGERAMMAERLARDPALSELVDDLTRLRAELESLDSESPAPRVLPFRRQARPAPAAPTPPVGRRVATSRFALGALAAAALVAAIVTGPQLRTNASTSVSAPTPTSGADAPIARLGEKAQFVRSASEFERVAEPQSEVFADGFEFGSAASWTTASGS